MSDHAVSYRAATRLLIAAVATLLMALAGVYMRAEERHEERQETRIRSNEERHAAAEVERVEMKRDLDNVARGVQWLVNRRVEELGGPENLPAEPPVVDESTARSGG